MSVEKAVLGTMHLGRHGRGAILRDVTTARTMLEMFRAMGGREVETSHAYGDGVGEQLLGALEADRDFDLAVRYDPASVPGGHGPEALRNTLMTSLDRLGSHRAGLFYLSLSDPSTPVECILREVQYLHEEGWFAEFGLSGVSARGVEEVSAIMERHHWIHPTVYRGPYNVVMRAAETELLPLLRGKEIRFHASDPLADGLFVADPDLNDVAARFGISPVGAALRWLVHHSLLHGMYGDAIVVETAGPAGLGEMLAAVRNPPLPAPVLAAVEAAVDR